jgi:hypothetical protein
MSASSKKRPISGKSGKPQEAEPITTVSPKDTKGVKNMLRRLSRSGK